MVVFGLEFVVLTVIIALLFDFYNGMNDAANSIATIVATKVLRPYQAVILAAFFNFLGAFIGLEVAKTVGKGIVVPDVVTTELILAALVGGITWTAFCTQYGLPISVSHSLIGGLIGAGIAAAGLGGLELPTRETMMPAFVAIGHGAVGGAVLGILAGVLSRPRRLAQGVLVGALVGSAIWLAAQIFLGDIVVKGLFATFLFILYSPVLGFLGGYGLNVLIFWLFRKANQHQMRGWFRWLQVGSASFYSLGHGTNDAQKTMGVIAALLIANDLIAAEPFAVPTWVVVACGTAIALGTLIGGHKVVHTMGVKLTKLEPHQGFSAETSSAVGLYFLAQHGVPVSTTHSITGSIMGVGAVRGGHNVHWGVARTIVGAWVLTIPSAAIVSFVTFRVLVYALGALGVQT